MFWSLVTCCWFFRNSCLYVKTLWPPILLKILKMVENTGEHNIFIKTSTEYFKFQRFCTVFCLLPGSGVGQIVFNDNEGYVLRLKPCELDFLKWKYICVWFCWSSTRETKRLFQTWTGFSWMDITSDSRICITGTFHLWFSYCNFTKVYKCLNSSSSSSTKFYMIFF